MIEKYYKFDVDRFFRDYEFNKKTYTRLLSAKEEELTNTNANFLAAKVSNSHISNPTEEKAKRRLNIDEKLKELDEYFSAYECIFSQLSEDEKTIVERVFKAQSKTNRRKGIDRLKNDLHIEQTKVYNLINQTREKVADIASWV